MQEQAEFEQQENHNEYEVYEDEEDYPEDGEDFEGDQRDWKNWGVATFEPCAVSQNKGEQLFDEDQVDRFAQLNDNLEGEQYVDTLFPADYTSIFGKGKFKPSHYDEAKAKGLPWKRAQDIFKSEEFSVCEAIEIKDVKQGALGNCWFLAAVAAIAETNDRISRNFLQKEKNPTGMYCITLCLNGIWEEVFIDDQFPVNPDSGRAAFTYSESKELWVMLLEKAWAKVHGGYNAIVSGWPGEAFRDITGAPSLKFMLSDKTKTVDQFWEKILEATNEGYIMGGCTSDFSKTGNDSQNKECGLCGNHAYSFVGGYELSNATGELRKAEGSDPSNIRLIKLRNPWGNGEWKLDWSDNSPLWTQNLKDDFEMEKGNDGVFFMTFDDYRTYFHSFEVCYYDVEARYSALKVNSLPSDVTLIKFEVEEEGIYYLSLNQISYRYFAPTENYDYSPLSIDIVRVDGESSDSSGFTHVASARGKTRELVTRAGYSCGTHYAIILTPWKKQVNQFVISAYGPGDLTFEAQDANEEDGQAIVQNGILKKVLATGFESPKLLGNVEGLNYKLAYDYDGWGYILAQNESSEYDMKIAIDVVNTGAVQIHPLSAPHTKENQLVVGPYEQGILLYRYLRSTPDDMKNGAIKAWTFFGKQTVEEEAPEEEAAEE